MMSSCSGVNDFTGLSMGMLIAWQAEASMEKYQPRMPRQGRMAPSLRESDRSGMIRSSSSSFFVPRPMHSGQAP